MHLCTAPGVGDLRQVSGGLRAFGPVSTFVRYNAAFRGTADGIGDEKRVAPDFFNFFVGQIVRVPLFSYLRHQMNFDRFIEKECVFVID